MRKSILKLIESIRPFVPHAQLEVMTLGLSGEERGFFREKMREIERTIATMPVTYAQDGKGDSAVVYLHYFAGGADWWITEKDMDGGVAQAFGLVDLGGGPELGYVSIEELTSLRTANLDLHWKPKTIAEVKSLIDQPPQPRLVKTLICPEINTVH